MPKKTRTKTKKRGKSVATKSSSPQLRDKSKFENVPTYTVDLDLPPEDRWTHIINDYKDKLPIVLEASKDILGEYGESIVAPIISFASYFGLVIHIKELNGIAKAANLSFGQVVLLQIAYEASTGCTSVIKGRFEAAGSPLHIRTMDWDMDGLSDLTIRVNYTKNKEVLFSCTTWVGYIGVLTGVKANSFSVSVNYRRSKGMDKYGEIVMLQNLFRLIVGNWPVGYAVRDAMETCETFTDAVDWLQNVELIVPVYFTVCGCGVDEGAIITRDRSPNDPEKDVVFLGDDGTSCLVQTNMDCSKQDPTDNSITTYIENDWQNICDSRKRRLFVQSCLNTVEDDDVTETTMWQLMTTKTICVDDTIYTTFMHPADGGNITTRINKGSWMRVLRRDGRKRFGKFKTSVDRHFKKIESTKEYAQYVEETDVLEAATRQ